VVLWYAGACGEDRGVLRCQLQPGVAYAAAVLKDIALEAE